MQRLHALPLSKSSKKVTGFLLWHTFCLSSSRCVFVNISGILHCLRLNDRGCTWFANAKTKRQPRRSTVYQVNRVHKSSSCTHSIVIKTSAPHRLGSVSLERSWRRKDDEERKDNRPSTKTDKWVCSANSTETSRWFPQETSCHNVIQSAKSSRFSPTETTLPTSRE